MKLGVFGEFTKHREVCPIYGTVTGSVAGSTIFAGLQPE